MRAGPRSQQVRQSAPAGTRSSTVAGDAGPDGPAPMQGAGGRSVATDASVFLKALKQWEGQHPFMYADTRGYVTTGIGHLLKTPEGALKLPWQHSKTGQPATPAEVRSTFERVRQAAVQYQAGQPEREGNPVGRAARSYRIWFCRKVFDQTGNQPLEDEFLTGPAKAVSRLRPLSAAGAARDRGHGLQPRCREARTHVSRLRGGVRSRKFVDAAKESVRSSCREERNRATADLLDQAARLNASVRTVTREIRL